MTEAEKMVDDYNKGLLSLNCPQSMAAIDLGQGAMA